MSYLISGLILFSLGAAYRLTFARDLELELVRRLQQSAQAWGLIGLFREIWFFGRTSFALAVLVGLVLLEIKAGLGALLGFGLIVALEGAVKRIFNRKRPFQESDQVLMLQPREPSDPSFPSGDVLRIWYLAVILSTAVGNSIPFWAGAITLACLVSLGRLVMGVHTLSDILSGAGLGLLGAGLTTWLWTAYQLFL